VAFFRTLAFSTINYAFFGWLLWLAFEWDVLERNIFLAVLVWLFVFFVGPVALGLLFGFVWQRNIHRRMAGAIGIRIPHPIPNSWDYMFDSVGEPSWMLVTLIDGSQVAGYFGRRSFASSDPNERDIFLEQCIGSTRTALGIGTTPEKGSGRRKGTQGYHAVAAIRRSLK
jgi:hypothetical protein